MLNGSVKLFRSYFASQDDTFHFLARACLLDCKIVIRQQILSYRSSALSLCYTKVVIYIHLRRRRLSDLPPPRMEWNVREYGILRIFDEMRKSFATRIRPTKNEGKLSEINLRRFFFFSCIFWEKVVVLGLYQLRWHQQYAHASILRLSFTHSSPDITTNFIYRWNNVFCVFLLFFCVSYLVVREKSRRHLA